MVFGLFESNLQSIAIYNYQVVGKVLMIASLLFFSIYFLKNVLKNLKQTDFMVVAFLRLYFIIVSFASLVLSLPMLIIFLDPNVPFEFVFKLIFGLYKIGLVFGFVLVLLDAVKNTFFVFLEMAGLNTKSKSAEKIKNIIKNNKLLKLRW